MTELLLPRQASAETVAGTTTPHPGARRPTCARCAGADDRRARPTDRCHHHGGLRLGGGVGRLQPGGPPALPGRQQGGLGRHIGRFPARQTSAERAFRRRLWRQPDPSRLRTTDNAAGRVAAIAAGLEAADATPPTVAPMDAGAMRALWLVQHPAGLSRAPKQFVDLQNDVAASDILLAVREGFESIEHVKRNTAMGFGTDQGRTGNIKLATRRQHRLQWQKRELGPSNASIKGFQSRNEKTNTYLSFKLRKSLQRPRLSSTRTSTSAAPSLQLTPCTPSAMG